MIRLLIVDDHAVVRAGIKSLLRDANDITVVAETDSGEEAVQIARTLNPDVILMDINMPGIGGLEAAKRLLSYQPSSRILVVSSHEDPYLPKRLIHMGVLGYLHKRASSSLLIRAIRQIYSGETFIDPSMTHLLASQSNPAKQQNDPLERLNHRELQLLMMIARGFSLRDIAQKLFVSPKTLQGNRRDTFQKIGVKSDVEATRFAISKGLIEADRQWH